MGSQSMPAVALVASHISGFRPTLLRSPLRVGAVDDPAEVEAEAVADRVMRMPDPGPALLQRCPGGCPDEEVVRRQPEDEEDELRREAVDDEEELQLSAVGPNPSGVDAATATAIGARRGGGAPLPETARRFFEPRFGADLSGVRVHHDGAAAELARSVNARAFTIGPDVFFGSGEWAPNTGRGDRLLAHELSHTVQRKQLEGMVVRRLTDDQFTCGDKHAIEVDGQKVDEPFKTIKSAIGVAGEKMNVAITRLQAVQERVRLDERLSENDPRRRYEMPGRTVFPLVDEALERAGMNPDALSVWMDEGPCTVDLLLTRLRQIRGLMVSDWVSYKCSDELIDSFCGRTTTGSQCSEIYAEACTDGNFLIRLCKLFWTTPSEQWPTIIHEVAHLAYEDVDDAHAGNIGNAFCYEAVVKELNDEHAGDSFAGCPAANGDNRCPSP